MEEKLLDYVTYCKNHAIDELDEMRGWDNEVYMSELGMKLTENINIDGSATYSTYMAKQYIKEWFDEAGEVYEYEKDNYGEVLHNPFESPEAFHVCMIIHGVENILSQCPTVQKLWDEEILLTDEIIGKIIAEIEEVKEINL